MKAAVIGSGNVATHLAKALNSANVQIVNVWSFHLENAQLLAQQVNAKAINRITEVQDDCDIVFISVKDDAIAEVAAQLSNFKGIVAHTAGAAPLTTLSSLENYGVFYPLQTFSKQKEVDFSAVPLCLEGNTTATLLALKKLASLLSEKVYEVDSEQRKILHLAAVFACNFPNYLYGIAQQLLAQHELDFEIIRPLITETANKVQTSLPMKVQTGPAIRNDEKTLAKHEALLQNSPQWLTIYKLLSDQIKKSE